MAHLHLKYHGRSIKKREGGMEIAIRLLLEGLSSIGDAEGLAVPLRAWLSGLEDGPEDLDFDGILGAKGDRERLLGYLEDLDRLLVSYGEELPPHVPKGLPGTASRPVRTKPAREAVQALRDLLTLDERQPSVETVRGSLYLTEGRPGWLRAARYDGFARLDIQDGRLVETLRALPGFGEGVFIYHEWCEVEGLVDWARGVLSELRSIRLDRDGESLTAKVRS